MLYIFPCSVSLPSQSVQLFFTFFCFQSSIQIVIRTSLRHFNCLLALLFFVYLFSIFISYFVSCFLCLFLFFYALLNFLIPPPCFPVSILFPKYYSQYSFSCFFSISVVLSHSSGNPSLPPRILVTSCLNAS